jgi:segregation and condensation protein B
MNEFYVRNVVEAALLAAGKPLQLAELGQLFEDSTRPKVEDLQAGLEALAADYANRGLELKETAAGFRIQVRKEFAGEISRLWPERPAKYSRALLETLALIAYRQPITRAEIEQVRGVAVNPNIVKTVIERNWVRVVGHRDVPGRPELLGTTREFLDYFGLRSLDELPALVDVKAMGDYNLQLELPNANTGADGAAAVAGLLTNEGAAAGEGAAEGGAAAEGAVTAAEGAAGETAVAEGAVAAGAAGEGAAAEGTAGEGGAAEAAPGEHASSEAAQGESASGEAGSLEAVAAEGADAVAQVETVEVESVMAEGDAAEAVAGEGTAVEAAAGEGAAIGAVASASAAVEGLAAEGADATQTEHAADEHVVHDTGAPDAVATAEDDASHEAHADDKHAPHGTAANDAVATTEEEAGDSEAERTLGNDHAAQHAAEADDSEGSGLGVTSESLESLDDASDDDSDEDELSADGRESRELVAAPRDGDE